MATSIASTRLDEETERRVDATAEQRGMTRSDWLRQAIETAIEVENKAADQAPTFVSMDKRMANLEADMRETLKNANKNLKAIEDLSNLLAVERAADRAVAQQVYRMALRSSLLCTKIIVNSLSEEDRDGMGKVLSSQADEIYNSEGLARLDQVMRDAREDLRQSIERGGTS